MLAFSENKYQCEDEAGNINRCNCSCRDWDSSQYRSEYFIKCFCLFIHESDPRNAASLESQIHYLWRFKTWITGGVEIKSSPVNSIVWFGSEQQCCTFLTFYYKSASFLNCILVLNYYTCAKVLIVYGENNDSGNGWDGPENHFLLLFMASLSTKYHVYLNYTDRYDYGWFWARWQSGPEQARVWWALPCFITYRKSRHLIRILFEIDGMMVWAWRNTAHGALGLINRSKQGVALLKRQQRRTLYQQINIQGRME